MARVKRIMLVLLVAVSAGATILGSLYYLATHEGGANDALTSSTIPTVKQPNWIDLEKTRFGDLTQENLNIERFHAPGNPGNASKQNQPTKGPCSADLRENYSEFLKRMTRNNESRPGSNTSLSEAERNLIDQWISIESSPGQHSETAIIQTLSTPSEAASANNSTDGLVRSIHGALLLRQNLLDDAKNRFSGLTAILKEQGYSLYLQAWVAALQLQVEKTHRTPATAETAAAFNAIAVEYLQTASAEPADYRFAWTIIDLGLSNMSVEQQENLFSDVLAAGMIAPWFVHLIGGKFFDRKSWETRGSGFADTVNKLQWQGFKEFQQRASLHFQKAWLLRPEIPFASKEMIMISMAHGDEWSPRDWFDITIRAQRDYEPAFGSYLHTLKPRWGGSLDAMFEFANECGQSNDFDTLVPNYALHVVETAAKEIPDAPHEVLEHPGLQAMLRGLWTAVDDALQNKTAIPDGRLRIHLSWRAAIALKQKDLVLLKDAMQKLNGPIWAHPYSVLFKFPQMAISQTYSVARCGEEILPLGDRFGEDFDGRITQKEIDETRKRIEELSTEATPEETLFFESLRIVLQQLEDFHSGTWVNPKFVADMPGWAVFGTAQIENETSVLVSNIADSSPYPGIALQAAFPPPYEILATVDGLRGPVSLVTAGIEVGAMYESSGTSESPGRYFYANVNEDIVGVTSANRQYDGAWHTDGIARPIQFRIRVFNSSFEMQANGINLPVVPTNTFVGSPRFLLGGSKRLLDKGAVRISDVRIHRLEVERPDGESTDASAWRSYYESIVAFDTGDSHALLELASLYAAAEEWPRAASCLKKASENGPFSFERIDLLLTISMATSNFVDAKPMIEAAMERFPEQPEYAEMMTWICATASDEKLRDAQRAVELATRLVKNEHSLSWKGHRAIAAAFAENENFAEAVLQMEQALTKAPESQKEEISAMLRQLTEKQPIRTTPSE
jgi:hypothetical protein